MKFSLLAIFASLALAKHELDPPGAPFHPSALEAFTDMMLYQKTIKEFASFRKQRVHVEGLIWSDDGCHHVSDKPFGWDFSEACNRHNFGYQNYKAQHRFDKLGKKTIDLNFKRDMFNQCAIENGSRSACRTTAKTWYWGVRQT